MDDSAAAAANVRIVDTVKRFPTPLVRDRHWDGLFGGLGDVIEARITALEAARSPWREELIRFWRYALKELDHDLHASIQRKYLRQGETVRISGESDAEDRQEWLKYIDPIIWFESKLRFCQCAGLDRSPPLAILDIGTGPGHFAFAARFYGHDVVGLEVPEELNTGNGVTFLYDDLCQLYGVARVGHRIVAGERLPDLGRRFNFVSGWMAAFNTHSRFEEIAGGVVYYPWDAKDWEHFIRSCKERWLEDSGRIILTLAREKVCEASWAYLVSKARQVDQSRYFVDIAP